jgi:Ni/Co efflux regulator RcnB
VDQNRLRRRDQANDRWRHDNQRHIELRRWQRSHHARHRFHVGPYRGPRGYYYHRWNYGQYLPPMYFVRSYWLIDFLIYGLMAPPPGCIWVRYGPDALLIDLETGEIVQVVYGVFY